MDSIFKIIETDKFLITALKNVLTMDTLNIKNQIEILDSLLFRKFCDKTYLSQCEPFYCTTRYTNACKYIIALKYIKEKYNIDIVNKTIISR